MKKISAIILALLICALLCACGAGENLQSQNEAQTPQEAQQSALVEDPGFIADPADYQFAIVYGGVHPYFEPYEPGAKAAAKDLGIPEPYIVSPQAWDQTEQNQVLD